VPEICYLNWSFSFSQFLYAAVEVPKKGIGNFFLSRYKIVRFQVPTVVTKILIRFLVSCRLVGDSTFSELAPTNNSSISIIGCGHFYTLSWLPNNQQQSIIYLIFVAFCCMWIICFCACIFYLADNEGSTTKEEMKARHESDKAHKDIIKNLF
jgi:hypothetical protein